MEEKDGRKLGEKITPESWRQACIKVQAITMCRMVGIEAIDSLDGSSNWWMFNQTATQIVDDLFKKFPPDFLTLLDSESNTPPRTERGAG